MEKPAVTDAPLVDVIRRRWSPFAYDPDREIDRTDLRTLLEAARWAPSARNDQPWRFIVLDRSVPEIRAEADACLAEINVWAKRAPLLLVAAARTTYEQQAHAGKPNEWAWYDAGAAVENLLLQATSIGIVGRQIGLFDRDKLRRLLGVPEGFDLPVIVALGYHGDPDNLSGTHRERHEKPRVRKPIEEATFKGTWGTPLA